MSDKEKRKKKRLKKKRERQRHRGDVPPSLQPPTPSAVSPRPHTFNIAATIITISLGVITLLLSAFGVWWTNFAQPDIRYIANTDSESVTEIDSKVDSAGNFVHNLRLRAKFMNVAFKSGFIDKAEFIPETIETLPDIKITGIGKTPLRWREETPVEITFIMTIPTDSLNHLNTTRELKIEQVLSVFDNTGKKVDHLTNGMLGRIKMNFKQVVKLQATSIHP
ncbi:MAG: hypothetical protein DMG49_15040 [Acidobacteria bacterium]|nr:MAG: hypothetical protein DMG49_15040 [Acidobacteriota bacterium]